jgi:hypothetical protein
MMIWTPIFIALSAAAAISAYRLGMADGLSAARRGRLIGGKESKKEELLRRIDAYDGRKENYANN